MQWVRCAHSAVDYLIDAGGRGQRLGEWSGEEEVGAEVEGESILYWEEYCRHWCVLCVCTSWRLVVGRWSL